MKYGFVLLVLVTIVFILVLSVVSMQTKGHAEKHEFLEREISIQQCPVNPDKRYSRQSSLHELAKMLDGSVPEYKAFYTPGFYVKDEGAATFDIYDLIDPTNVDSVRAGRRCINFLNGHIYHVYPAAYEFSFSHIVILEDGHFTAFKSINCEGRGDTLDDVLRYLKQNGTYDQETLERVKRYREYGSYTRTDNYSRLKCKEIDTKVK
jgi:hypothetical protein